MMSFIKILLQFGSFKINFMKNQLSFIILKKNSENTVQFSKQCYFYDCMCHKMIFWAFVKYWKHKYSLRNVQKFAKFLYYCIKFLIGITEVFSNNVY